MGHSTRHSPPGHRERYVRAAARCAALLLIYSLAVSLLPAAETGRPTSGGNSASRQPELEEKLGIRIFPGSSLIALEGPTLEIVDLERPGWEYTTAHVLVADFLVDATIADLRRYYRNLCTRDPKLLLVKKDDAPGVIVSVRHANRHPLHPKKRWLRVVTYRLPVPAHPDVSRKPLQRDGE